jgi:hypothetical protein
MKLSDLDKYNIYDLSSILFSILNKPEPVQTIISTSPQSSSSPSPQSPLQSPSYHISKPVQNVKKIDPKSKKSVEIDGVTYSSEEKLTSLDDRIEKQSDAEIIQESLSSVEYDGRLVPIPEKEFARGFIKRVKGS